ncbi:hypothetical protein GCM10028807_27880 [Spirosoma daeguense]
MATVEHLNWDSDFFGKKIGKCELRTSGDIQVSVTLLSEAQKQDYALVYLFAPENISLPETIHSLFDARLVDTRLIYTLETDQSMRVSDPNVFSLQATDDKNKLYELAYQSGHYSRFKQDSNFSEADFKRLYRNWMDKSLEGQLADEVFVYKHEEAILGMITVKISGDIGTPGILATDQDHRGKGIGTAYFNHMLAYLHNKGVSRMNVVTQKANRQACQFYEKINCQQLSATDIYHVWL